jgi:large subunit ribosomal protein L1
VKINREKLYSIKEAVKLIKETSYSKFDGTMEMHLTVKKAGLSAQVTFPYTSGKTKKVEVASDETLKNWPPERLTLTF